MSARALAVDVLLYAGTAVVVLSSLSLLWMRSVYDRVHLIGPAAMLGVPLIAAALVVHEGVSPLSVKALLIVVVFWATGPTLTHATIRAARLRDSRAWHPGGRRPPVDR
jgi:multisubunit Na+/H+ antiporter MnhG subunit